MTERKYDPDHPVTYHQARCTNCGTIHDDYGDYTAFGDFQSALDEVIGGFDWFPRWEYETKDPTRPYLQTCELIALLCPDCQTCEICGGKGYEIDGHLVCEEHEDATL